MFSFLTHIPQVTKNILILNVLFFLAKIVFLNKGIALEEFLGIYTIGSPLFKPFQLVTHFFMHADFWHIFMNMWLFTMLGGFLERLWGPKRFFIFYVAAAIGAVIFENIFAVYNVWEIKKALAGTVDLTTINQIISSYPHDQVLEQVVHHLESVNSHVDGELLSKYLSEYMTPSIGASGGVFGILAAFAILFPNTEFMLYFAIPVKAKYLIGAYVLIEIYMAFQNDANDPVGHLAHIGGAIVGAILVLIWRKQDRKNFW
jgi:membrane associated rhomboid family serine protease